MEKNNVKITRKNERVKERKQKKSRAEKNKNKMSINEMKTQLRV